MGIITIGSVLEDLGPTPPGWFPGCFPLDGDISDNRNAVLDRGKVSVWRTSTDQNDLGSSRSIAELKSKIAAEIADPDGIRFGKALRLGYPVVFGNCLYTPAFATSSGNVGFVAMVELRYQEEYGYAVGYATLSACIENGRDTNLCLFSFKNEATTTNFFNQSVASLLRHYSAYAHGIRRAANDLGVVAKVGGLELFQQPDRGDVGFLGSQQTDPQAHTISWLKYCKNPPTAPYEDVYAGSYVGGTFHPGSIPVDFVTWHYFQTTRFNHGDMVLRERDALVQAGYDPDLMPQYQTEFTAAGPFNFFPRWRSGAEGASNIIQCRRYQGWLDRSNAGNKFGIRGHAYVSVAFGAFTDPNGFNGGYGTRELVSAGVYINNSMWLADEMAVQLGPDLLGHTITQEDENYGISVTATKSGGDRFIIINRHQVKESPQDNPADSSHWVLARYLVSKLGYQRNGDVLTFDSGLTEAERRAFIAGTTSGQISFGALPAYFTGEPGRLPGRTLVGDLNEALAAALQSDTKFTDTAPITVEVTDPSFLMTWTGYRIRQGSVVNNPYAAFEAEWANSGAPINLTSIQVVSNVMKFVTAAPHGLSTNDIIRIDGTQFFTGGTPSFLDGTRHKVSVSGANTFDSFTFTQFAVNLGAVGTVTKQTGTYAAAVAAAQAQAMLTAFGSGTGADFPMSFDLDPYDTILLKLFGSAPMGPSAGIAAFPFSGQRWWNGPPRILGAPHSPETSILGLFQIPPWLEAGKQR